MNFDIASFDAVCVRAAAKAAQADDRYDVRVWVDPPTLMGWDHVAVELLGVVPTVEMPNEREIAP